jgi:Fe-S oxidoreductase
VTTTRIAVGLAITAIAFAIAGRRVFWLLRLVLKGQPAPDRLTGGYGKKLWSQVAEVFGQRKLLKWSVPGVAHFFTFWGFLILGLTIVESYAALFKRDWAGFTTASWIGFVEDFFAAAVVLALATFGVIRVLQDPGTKDRKSRFYGSHTGAAWGVLGMIFLVVATLIIYRAAQIKSGVFPYHDPSSKWAFFSYGVSTLLPSYATHPDLIDNIETAFILAQIAVVMTFLVLVVHSKHLHIFLAPINVMFGRKPKALGDLVPMLADGKPIDFETAFESEEEIAFGISKVEDFTWKGMLDFLTCTECGRCQSQCPAWNTGKPLSPKLLITDLRDHLFEKAPWVLGGEGYEGEAPEPHEAHGHEGQPGFRPSHNPNNVAPNERPIVGDADSGGVIDPDVLWSCTNCGACVEQCPVDIEHVDHILNMRRYQVLVESSFPSEAGVMLRNVENQGNPWGVSPRTRNEWYADLPFEVKVVDGPLAEDEYLLWVGCAGAIDDRGKKTSQALAELLHTAGVSFAILGEGETCTGDPVRRIGNEYLWSELAKANVETLTEAAVKKIVVTCPHCYNSFAKEYKQVGLEVEVVHHTELLAKLVADGKLTPVERLDAKVTYHDPCFLGRHNGIYNPPREVIGSLPGVELVEMPRHGSRSFCCGAGGARMWLEETIGTRVNINRAEEAVSMEPDVVAVGCPFCSTMLTDGVNAAAGGESGIEVLDVARLFARAMRKVPAPAAAVAEPEAPAETPAEG